MINISIVVPVYSGELYIQDLISEIKVVRNALIASSAPMMISEVILVDDNAIDNSGEIIDQLADKNDWIKSLHLSRNYGQHPATAAGILHSSGDWVVTLDEDLQQPPSDILDLLRKAIESKSDLVYGKSNGLIHRSIFRDWSSRLYKWIITHITDSSGVSDFNSFRLIRGEIARAAAQAFTHNLFLDVALLWFTSRIETCNVKLLDNRYIESGKSSYNFKSLISHAHRLAFSSQINLLRISALGGLAMISLSVLLFCVVLVINLFAPSLIEASGWSSLMLVLLLFGGVTLLLLGVILEYMFILSVKAQGRPPYLITKKSDDHALIEYFNQIDNNSN
jgi:glycosyltransferase involved in cell wall biosynthesis